MITANRFNKVTALVTAFVFAVTQFTASPEGWSATHSVSVGEVTVPSHFQLSLPRDLGRVETLSAGLGPTIIHIQEAHGNGEAQRKIKEILKFLKGELGIKLILLEGSAFPLERELVRFFPEQMDLTIQILDELAKKSVATAAELFVAEDNDAEAYGIENRDAYVENGILFRELLEQREKTETFVTKMDLQIERLSAPYLNPELREFLKKLEDYDANLIFFEDWLTVLKGKSKEDLRIDLTNPIFQIDWPMMLRVFTLKRFESEIDMDAFQSERGAFIRELGKAKGAGLARLDDDRIKALLDSSLFGEALPDPETGLLFERMMTHLTRDFDHDAYPNVKLFIGHLILQSELKAELLMKEVDRLTEKLTEKLAQTKQEKQLVALLRDYRLLKRLFALELTTDDYEAILSSNSLHPSTIAERFLALNDGKRVRNIEFTHIQEIESLFDRALEFYEGARERDRWMFEQIESRLKETGEDKAVVITGGFHAGPFKTFFKKRGYSYALITPKMTTLEGRDTYLESVLRDFRPSLTADPVRGIHPSNGAGVTAATWGTPGQIGTLGPQLASIHWDPAAALEAVIKEIRVAGADPLKTAYVRQFAPQVSRFSLGPGDQISFGGLGITLMDVGTDTASFDVVYPSSTRGELRTESVELEVGKLRQLTLTLKIKLEEVGDGKVRISIAGVSIREDHDETLEILPAPSVHELPGLAEWRRDAERFPDVDSELLDRPWHVLLPMPGYSTDVRVKKMAHHASVSTVRDLVSRTSKELLEYKNFSDVSLNALRLRLAEHALFLKDDARLGLPITDERFHFSVRAQNMFSEKEIKTLAGVVKATREGTLQWNRKNQRVLREVQSALKPSKLILRDTEGNRISSDRPELRTGWLEDTQGGVILTDIPTDRRDSRVRHDDLPHDKKIAILEVVEGDATPFAGKFIKRIRQRNLHNKFRRVQVSGESLAVQLGGCLSDEAE